MKKVLALVLVMAMLCCGVCCAETAAELTGTWYAELMGMVVTLNLNEDGTCAMEVMGQINEGAWVVEDNALYINKGQEDESPMSIVDGTLVAEAGEGMTLVFGREPIAAIELPAAVAAADIAAFDGNWNPTYVDAFGMVLDMATAMEEGLGELFGADDDLSLVINNGEVSMFGQEALPFTFADGALTLSAGDEEIDLSMTVSLCDDGSLVMNIMGMNLYFAAAE